MRILVVEDSRDFLEDLMPTLRALPGSPEVTVVLSRDSAVTLLDADFYDLIVLDLTIPTIDGALDAAIEHGNAVFMHGQKVAPGTPIFILTGSSADEIFSSLLDRKDTVELWGDHTRRGTIDFLQKRKFDEIGSKLSPIAEAIRTLRETEVGKKGATFDLSIAEDRLVRSFARGRGGVRCELGVLSGGLSDARVFRIRVFDQSGATRINAIAKIGSRTAVNSEAQRYDNEISRLSQAATPRRLETIEFGGKSTAAVFYSLAETYDNSLFQVLLEQPALAARVVEQVELLTARWREGVPETRCRVGDVRRRVLSDAELREIAAARGLEWVAEFEQRKIQVRLCTIHGDLHGENVLVDREGGATLIDYGDVGEGAASLDPITLEMSPFFHPVGTFVNSDWPRPEQARVWRTDEYLADCPAAEFFKRCWAWEERSCAGHRGIAAAAYAYLARQLKYADTNKQRVIDLITGTRAFFDRT